MREIYRRVETIDQIVTTDRIAVIDSGRSFERVGESEHKGKGTMRVQWFTAEGMELPESSAIYLFLENNFHTLPED